MRYHVLFLSLTFSTLLSFGQSADKEAYRLGVEGIQKVDAGNFEEGIKLLKKARNIDPKEYDYALEIGKAYLKSGNAKKAEKYLFDLQYHANVQPDLYLLLGACYKELELGKKTPDTERKKELKTLRYGVEKLPNSGVLYLELGKLHLEMKHPEKALVVWEKGIRKAPNFAENYFWAAKLMKASRNHLWVWIYAETFFNMVENSELKRSAAKLSSFASATVLEDKWNADPEKMDQDLKVALLQNCSSLKGGQSIPLEKITCLLKNWDYKKYSAAPLFNRMKNLEKRGWLEAYLASILQETDKEKFLRWLVNNAKTYEEYRKWSYWNRLELLEAINRLLE